jgi:uncharacterized protein (DUF2147 family)
MDNCPARMVEPMHHTLFSDSGAALCAMKNVLAASLAWLTILLTGAGAWAADGDFILGIWNTADNRSQVRIFKRNDHYFGQIMSLAEPNWPLDDKQGMGGKPKTDRNNPKPELRARLIAGIEFMNDFVYAGNNLWEDGKIYDPEAGKTYRCKMTAVSTNRLEVRGFIGVSLFGRTATWSRGAP